MVHESVDDVLVAHEGRHVDGCQARLQTHKHCYSGGRGDAESTTGGRGASEEEEPNLRHGLDGRAVFEQELHHLGSVLLAGDVERREAVLRPHTQTRVHTHTKGE